MVSFIRRIKSELERPREERRLGSGWLSGSGSILAGLTGLLLLLVLRYPTWFQTPELSFLHESGYVRPFMHVVLLLGYAFALISLLLNKDKTLGIVGLCLNVGVALMGGSQTEAVATSNTTSLYFGLDYFILNVLFVGFLFIPLERIFPSRGEQTVFRPEWQEDMFYYLVSSMFVQILTFLSTAPANFVGGTFDLTEIHSTISATPFVLQVIIIMVLTDLVQYWLHRLFHTVPFLWRFHSIHHSAKTMDWLAGARMHILEIAMLRGLTAIPMLTFGFDAAAIQTYLLIVYFYSSFVHANIGWNLKFVEKFLVTPRFHHWHHGSEKEAIDINYAIHFPLYDWLFGTYHMPENGEWPKLYGVVGDNVPRGYWRQLIHPFRKDEHSDKSASEPAE